MSSSTPSGPYKLVTVNTAPERAAKVIGRVADDLKDRFLINHVANCTEIAQVEQKVKEHQPDILFCASMWTAEQASEIIAIATRLKPGIRTYAIPYGLQVAGGPDAVVAHLDEVIPGILSTSA